MPVEHSGKNFYSTKEACDRIGRSKNAVLRWIALGYIPDVGRDSKNYRVWTEEDIQNYRKLRDELNKAEKQTQKERTASV